MLVKFFILLPGSKLLLCFPSKSDPKQHYPYVRVYLAKILRPDSFWHPHHHCNVKVRTLRIATESFLWLLTYALTCPPSNSCEIVLCHCLNSLTALLTGGIVFLYKPRGGAARSNLGLFPYYQRSLSIEIFHFDYASHGISFSGVFR